MDITGLHINKEQHWVIDKSGRVCPSDTNKKHGIGSQNNLVRVYSLIEKETEFSVKTSSKLEVVKKVVEFAADIVDHKEDYKRKTNIFRRAWHRIRYGNIEKKFDNLMDHILTDLKMKLEEAEPEDKKAIYDLINQVKKEKTSRNIHELKGRVDSLRVPVKQKEIVRVVEKKGRQGSELSQRVVKAKQPAPQPREVQSNQQEIEAIQRQIKDLLNELKKVRRERDALKKETKDGTRVIEEWEQMHERNQAEQHKLRDQIRLLQNALKERKYLEENEVFLRSELEKMEKEQRRMDLLEDEALQKPELEREIKQKEEQISNMDRLIAQYGRMHSAEPIAYHIVERFEDWIAQNQEYSERGNDLLNGLVETEGFKVFCEHIKNALQQNASSRKVIEMLIENMKQSAKESSLD